MEEKSKWQKEKIENLCFKPQYGYTSKSIKNENDNPQYLRTTDITKDDFDWSTVPYCDKPVKNEGKYLIDEGDIFVTRPKTSEFF
ncbi:MAG: hypothetical protein AB1498_09680 [bacterium]